MNPHTQPVRANGMISVPLLNNVQAAGLTPMELAASIMEKLKKYIEVPQVAVVVTQMNSQKSYLTGEQESERGYFPIDSKWSKPQTGTSTIIRDLEDSPQGPTISVPR